MQHSHFQSLNVKNMCVFFQWCRKSNNVRLRTFKQSGCLHSSSFFEHYNHILLCDWVLRRYSVWLRACACHNTFLLYLALTRVGLRCCSPTLHVVLYQVSQV